jgi:hypothetical protein
VVTAFEIDVLPATSLITTRVVFIEQFVEQ